MKNHLFKNMKILFFFSVLFFFLILANYFINLHILKGSIQDQQKSVRRGVSDQIESWLHHKINAIHTIKNFIKHVDHVQNKEEIVNVLKKGSQVARFASTYIGYSDNTIVSSREWLKPMKYDTLSRPWYQKTLSNNKTTITEPYIDIGLNAVVVSICAPFVEDTQKDGVLCGILPLENIKKEILDITLPYEGKAFLLDHNQRILVHPEKEKNLSFFYHKINSSSNILLTQNPKLKNYIFTYEFIKSPKWYLVIQLNKAKVYERVDLYLRINFIIYGISLIVFIILIMLYNYWQYTSDEKLKTAKSLIRSFLKYSDRGVIIADETNQITFKNDQLVSLLRIKEKKSIKSNSLLNMQIFSYFSKQLQETIFNTIWKAKNTNKTSETTLFFKENNKSIYIRMTVIPIFKETNKYEGLIIFFHDITEKEEWIKQNKEKEDILFQQSKMADLGEMMGAISHQWKQPLNSLSILLGNLDQFKKMDCLSDEVFQKHLDHALSNTHYLATTIDTFRDFFKPQKIAQEFVIDEAIEDTKFIIEPYFKNSGISINIIKNEDTLYTCNNYKNEFQQIIASLILNARDALLEEKTKGMKIDIRLEQKNENYLVYVEDNGPGIAQNIQEKLFLPFKTTKGEKGTGHGLYLSRLIAIKRLQGDLSIASLKTPTSFLLKLPTHLKDR